MVVLGIDPGSRRMGFGLVRHAGRELEFLAAGTLPIRSGQDAEALAEAKAALAELVSSWRPDLAAVEKIFFSKNRRTAIQVAQARGVALAACAELGLPIRELTPTEMKSALTGYGSADKRAVLKMVRLLLRAPELKVIDDASDALGLAIVAGGERRLGAPPIAARGA
jgi:crossover junction endodeoxyribonuclease RuvC